MLMKLHEHFMIAGEDYYDSNKIVCYSRFNSMGMHWPKEIEYNNKLYLYDGLDCLAMELIGTYFSCAKYQRVEL